MTLPRNWDTNKRKLLSTKNLGSPTQIRIKQYNYQKEIANNYQKKLKIDEANLAKIQESY